MKTKLEKLKEELQYHQEQVEYYQKLIKTIGVEEEKPKNKNPMDINFPDIKF